MSVQWLLNGTLDDGLNMNVVSEFGQISRVGHLIIRDVLVYFSSYGYNHRSMNIQQNLTYVVHASEMHTLSL